MNASHDGKRVLVAVTDSSPLQPVWETALDRIGTGGSEVSVVFVDDRRWHKAASLPFTCEISKITGDIIDFTHQRADQLSNAATLRARKHVEQLARKSRLSISFEKLVEGDRTRLEELIKGAESVFIIPAHIADSPMHRMLVELKSEIVLVESRE